MSEVSEVFFCTIDPPEACASFQTVVRMTRLEADCHSFQAIFQFNRVRHELCRAMVHLEAYRHHRKECPLGSNCHLYSTQSSHKDPMIQATYSRAHCLVYHHGEDMKVFEDSRSQPFHVAPPPNLVTVPLPIGRTPEAGLAELVQEARKNSFETMTVSSNIHDVLATMMNHPIHVALGKPLLKAEMMALLLYTGTRLQPHFSACQREGDLATWKTLRYWLDKAIHTLNGKKKFEYVWRYRKDIVGGEDFDGGDRVEDVTLRTYNNEADPHYGSFAYVEGPDLEPCDIDCYVPRQAIVTIGGCEHLVELVCAHEFLADTAGSGWTADFPHEGIPQTLWRGLKCTKVVSAPSEIEHFGFLSTSTSRRAVEHQFLGRDGCDRAVGVLFQFKRDEKAVWADVSWISKFPQEKEILFARTKWQLIEEGIVHEEYKRKALLSPQYHLIQSAISDWIWKYEWPRERDVHSFCKYVTDQLRARGPTGDAAVRIVHGMYTRFIDHYEEPLTQDEKNMIRTELPDSVNKNNKDAFFDTTATDITMKWDDLQPLLCSVQLVHYQLSHLDMVGAITTEADLITALQKSGYSDKLAACCEFKTSPGLLDRLLDKRCITLYEHAKPIAFPLVMEVDPKDDSPSSHLQPPINDGENALTESRKRSLLHMGVPALSSGRSDCPLDEARGRVFNFNETTGESAGEHTADNGVYSKQRKVVQLEETPSNDGKEKSGCLMT